jgi:DNA-binding CsgD family transcriptional regulator
VIGAALRGLSLAPDVLEPAERAGLVRLAGEGVAFRHPLVRAAAYHGSSLAEQRRAHETVAAAQRAAGRPDVAAWHAAAAAAGPDERVAAELEAAAESAGARGGVAARARALERAARLTPDGAARARRLAEAARASFFAGFRSHADELVREALPLLDDPQARAVAQETRALALAAGGVVEPAIELFDAEGTRLAAVDRSGAARLLGFAAWACFLRLDAERAVAFAERGFELAQDERPPGQPWAWLQYANVLAGRLGDVRALIERCTGIQRELGLPAQPMPEALEAVERYEEACAICQRGLHEDLSSGNLFWMPDTCRVTGGLELILGRTLAAYTLVRRGIELTLAVDDDRANGGTFAAMARIEAVLGREADARAHAAEALRRAGPERRWVTHHVVPRAVGLLGLAIGRPDETIATLEPIVGLTYLPPCALGGYPDLVEAYVRERCEDAAVRALEEYERRTAQTGRVGDAAAVARCRLLLCDDGEIDRWASEAVAGFERIATPLDVARTQLAYGQRLRRARRRADSRNVLRTALAGFERLAAAPFAEQARQELVATGETARRRVEATIDELTGQELQIALMVASGASNRETAAQLFLSTRTVENHLGRVYRKLGLRSRTELAAKLAVGVRETSAA